jgi:glutaredoxin 3
MESLGVKYMSVELDQASSGAEIQSHLISKYQQKTVPYVFINGQLIGGSDDVHRLNDQGKLQELLQQRNGWKTKDEI